MQENGQTKSVQLSLKSHPLYLTLYLNTDNDKKYSLKIIFNKRMFLPE